MLLHGQRAGTYGHATVLDKEVLHDACSQNDADKQVVVEEPMEDVVLLEPELPGIDLVEDLHEHKSVEDQSVVLGLLSGGEGAINGVNDEEGDVGIVGVTEEVSTAEKQHK